MMVSMMRSLSFVLLGSVSLMLGACATAVPPVEVTRFHTNQPAAWQAGSRYVVDSVPLADPSQAVGASASSATSSIEWNSYRAAVERQLQLQGLTAAPDGSAAPLKIRIGFDRYERTPAGKRSPVSVGVGGSTGSYGSGVGLGIGINLGGGPKPTQELSLFVRLDDANTGQALWEGRALTTVSSKAPASQPSLAAAKLAEALFKDFPGVSGRTISVP
jgi:hypothetical protein